jgi:dipeptidyl aminopeptidase/acylaminoacyl peptidase
MLRLVCFTLPILLSCSLCSHQTQKSEIVRFSSGGITLEGVLDLPGTEGKFPLVVFVHGSGHRTRSDYSEFVAPFLKNGFATFRYDKRGVGNSGGTYSDVDVGTENSSVTIHTLARDVAAAVKTLKRHGGIDSARCILVGASQAGWIIPVAASLDDIYMTAIFSGPSVTVGEEIYYSSLAEQGDYSVSEANKMVLSYHGIKGYDPIPDVSKITRPALWIFGKEDESIPVDRSVELLEQVRDQFALPIQIQVIPGVNHSMRSKDGKVADYVTHILDWIKGSR